VFDLPGGHPRLTTAPIGVHGVWVNGYASSDLPGRSKSANCPDACLREFVN
jgi:hypothetical protein